MTAFFFLSKQSFKYKINSRGIVAAGGEGVGGLGVQGADDVVGVEAAVWGGISVSECMGGEGGNE